MFSYPLFSHNKYWAKRFGVAPVLPMSRAEMEQLGWDSCDVILVTGDAYIDHPSFGMAVIGRVLEACGFRVGIIAQPDWRHVDDFTALGKPNLFFGVTAGNMDSMINHYTADKKPRSDDAYSPEAKAGLRPDRATLVYTQRCQEAYKGTPVVIGGIEASLRRLAHFDYWSDKVRRSILIDSKADLLVFGNGERQVVEIAYRLSKGESIDQLTNIRGTTFSCKHNALPINHVVQMDFTDPETMPVKLSHLHLSDESTVQEVIRIPSYEQVKANKDLYAHASRTFHAEMNPDNGRMVVQQHGDRDVVHNQPAIALTTEELDKVFDLPYNRMPHDAYQKARFPAYDMIRFSVNIMRGCFGGCSFCSITEHEGKAIQSRSENSIIREVEKIRDTTPGFTGTISDLGGPTANMWRMECTDREVEKICRRPSCVYPSICSYLGTDHSPLIKLYRRARELPGIKKIAIASGLRYDLAVRSPEYVEELVTHHVGGYLKIAPEHTEKEPLSLMMKPGMESYYEFEKMFYELSKKANKEQYLIPYFIAGHPGSTDETMLKTALWLKQHQFQLDQVQNFIPSPMARASTMYHTRVNILQGIKRADKNVFTARGERQRKIQKAFLRYHDPENWPLLRQALRDMGRADLIGNGAKYLIPSTQPTKLDPRVSGAEQKYRAQAKQLLTGGENSARKRSDRADIKRKKFKPTRRR
jgi:uncharacterized radical SAM protein YgiQ